MTASERANRARRTQAMKALSFYGELTGDTYADHQTWLIDLLADLLHLEQARKDYKAPDKKAIDFNNALRIATQHWYAEGMEGEL